jgi:hypothetical protein
VDFGREHANTTPACASGLGPQLADGRRVLLLAPFCAALAIAIAPPERDDLLDLADEGDILDQARIEQALYDTTMTTSGLRLLEQEIRDRRDRTLLRDRSRAIVAGVRLTIIDEDIAVGARTTIGVIAFVGISFDLLFSEIRNRSVVAPIAEIVRAQHCDRLLEPMPDRRSSPLSQIAQEEIGRALGCGWTPEGEAPWRR